MGFRLASAVPGILQKHRHTSRYGGAFMSITKKCALYSPDLLLAYTDFILSRQGKSSSQQTIDFYYYTVGKFLEWAEKNHNVTKPEELTARHVREYIVLL